MAERPLHVLIAGINWPPETFIARLVQGLLDRGLTVTVATATKPSTLWQRQPGFNWLFTPAWQGGKGRRLIRLASLLLRAMLSAPGDGRRLATKPFLFNWYHFLPFAGRRWDVIYFPWNSAAVFYWPLFDLGCPVVISCRGSQINVAPHNPRRAELVEGLRVTLSRTRAVHCVSEAIKNEAMQYGLEPRKATVIRPAVDSDFFYPLSSQARQPEPPLRIITTGSLIWRKGYECGLLAVRQLVDEGVSVHLDIIGAGPERQRVLYTIDDLGLQGMVRLYGQLTPEQVRDKLQQADVFLLASLSEGISNAVLEAMACGLPVVTTDGGGMGEAVTDGVEGFVVPIWDAAAMAAALKQLASKPELRQTMGQAGRQRICQQFTLSQQVESFVSLFRSCISTHS